MENNKRIIGFDVARAFAILGMMFVNYKIVFGYNVIHYKSIHHFFSIFEGRAAAVFIILAGIGIGLMTEKSYVLKDCEGKKEERVTLFKRALFLFVIGLIFFYVFEWTADILHFYGLYMTLIIGVLYFNKKRLCILIGLILQVSLLLQIFFDYTKGWAFEEVQYLDMDTLTGFIRNSIFNGFHPVFPWFAFMALGLLLSRYDLRNNRVQKKLFKFSFSIALTTEIISLLALKVFDKSELAIYFLDTKPMNPSILYMVASSGWAIAFIALILLITSTKKVNKISHALAQTGKLALSHYVFHFLFVLGAFELYDALAYKDEGFVLLLSVLVFSIMIVFSNVWLKKFKRGPLELLMRRISG